MATMEDVAVQRERLTGLLSDLGKFSGDALVRTRELGEDFDFRDGTDVFDRALKLFRELASVSLDGVPLVILGQLVADATEALNNFSAVASFKPRDVASPAAQRDQLINSIRDPYDGWFARAAPIVAYAVRRGTDFDALERQARKYVSDIEALRVEMTNALVSMRGEGEKILVGLRAVAADAGVSQQAFHFKTEADQQEESSFKWLIVTSIIGVIALAYAIYSSTFFLQDIKSATNAEAIQFAVSKLLAFSVLYFALVWAGRNFLAHRHNYIVNKHRQNALLTFQAFVSATGDEATKNAVLLKATEAIFSPEVSGYLSKEPDPRTSSSFIELVRSIEKP